MHSMPFLGNPVIAPWFASTPYGLCYLGSNPEHAAFAAAAGERVHRWTPPRPVPMRTVRPVRVSPVRRLRIRRRQDRGDDHDHGHDGRCTGCLRKAVA